MKPLPPNITLVKAQPSDIPAIHELGRLAFLPDAHTQMKNQVKGQNGLFDEGSSEYLKGLMDHSRIDCIVARETPSDTVVGYAAWAWRGHEVQPVAWGPSPAQPPLPSDRRGNLTVADLE